METIIIPTISESHPNAESHSFTTTTADKITRVEKTQKGSWLNGRWVADADGSIYQYEVYFSDRGMRYISEETYNMILEKVFRISE